ncbi:MAG: hypothetical protein U7126_13730 [Microcoleus sp.]
MSQNSQPVPRLDLAPKLSRPLSLWNPLDYLRLLYWVFFFPQALPWYIDTFGGKGFKEAKTGLQRWEWLRQNPIQPQLVLQVLTLGVVLLIILNGVPVRVGFAVNWWWVMKGIVYGVALSMASGVALSVVSGIVCGVAFGVVSGVASVVALSVAFGVVWGVMPGAAISLPYIVALFVVLLVVLGGALGVSLGEVWGVIPGVGFGVALGLVFARLEDWLFALPFTLLQPRNQNRYFPHITSIPLPYLSSQVANWLRRDWETGKHNINQLLRFTFQFIPVFQAVNKVLAETPPELLIYRVAQLADELYDWNLLRFASASLSGIRLDTPARAAAAGFWYLYVEKPKKATEAFAVVRELPYGEEMFTLAQILAAFHTTKEPAQIAALNLPDSPNQTFLHLTAWSAIAALRRVISDVQNIEQSASKSASVLVFNRAFVELQDILDGAENIPQAERKLIINIAQTWRINIAQTWQKSGLAITG